MEKISEKICVAQLDEFCAQFSDDISQLAASEYKLKSVFMLLHIIEVCRTTLDHMDISNFLDSLKKKINEVTEKTDLEKNQMIQIFMQDINVVEALENKDHVIDNLISETKRKIEELDNILGKIVKQRDQLTLPELKKE